MIKGISITVIIDEVKNEDSATAIKEALLEALPKETHFQSAEKYTKFEDAYKLEFDIAITESIPKEKLTYQLLMLTDCISRPWSFYFDKEGDNTELIFNRDNNSNFTQPVFSHIRWAHIQLFY
jgi:hypothetical protein